MKKTAQQIATWVLRKHAALSRDDISSGLAGTPHPQVTAEDIRQLADEMRQKSLHENRHAPLWGAGIGSIPGAITGAGIGSVKSPRGAGMGAIIGALGGAGLGALIGHGSRVSAGKDRQALGEELGGIAQTGSIPYELNERVRSVQDLIPHARGVQGSPQVIDPEEERQMRKDLARKLVIQRAMEGAAQGALSYGLHAPEGEGGEEALSGALVRGTIGAARGNLEAQAIARKVLDLKQRGYGTLGDRYLSEQQGVI